LIYFKRSISGDNAHIGSIRIEINARRALRVGADE
jgi:hypothetical protein